MKRKFTCSKCHSNPPAKSQRYCLPCHAKKMREFRKTHPLTPEQRKKDNCRSYAGIYLRRGKIVKEPCKICGDLNSQMHHPDYLKPLQIIWLCRPHHLKIHQDSIAQRSAAHY